MAASKNGNRVYLLELKGGKQRRVTVPNTWKVTFGPTIPYVKNEHRGNECWSLRFYEKTKDNLRAIFTDVVSFRDSEIPVSEKRIRTKRQVVEKESQKGGKAVIAEARIEEWIDPDAPDTEDAMPTDYLRLDYKHDDDMSF